MATWLKRGASAQAKADADRKVRDIVEAALADIEVRGHAALRAMSNSFDGWDREDYRLSQTEIDACVNSLTPQERKDIEFAHLASMKAEQERVRTERRDRALERRLHYRDRSPRGAAEHLADGARSIAQSLDRFLAGILDHARAEGKAPKTGIDWGNQSPAPRTEPSHGPER